MDGRESIASSTNGLKTIKAIRGVSIPVTLAATPLEAKKFLK